MFPRHSRLERFALLGSDETYFSYTFLTTFGFKNNKGELNLFSGTWLGSLNLNVFATFSLSSNHSRESFPILSYMYKYGTLCTIS